MAGPTLILITASDDYLLANKAAEVLSALVPESERAFGLETIDGGVDTLDAALTVLRQTRDALVQQSFFSEGKTVWLRHMTFLDAKRLGKSEAFAEAMDVFCDWLKAPGIPDGFTLLATSLSVPKTGRFYKTVAGLVKSGRAEILAVPDPSPKDAVNTVKDVAAGIGLQLSTAVAEAIVARVGYSPRILSMEIEKLGLYTGGEPATIEVVEAICTANAAGEFWDLTDVFGQHDLGRTLVVLRNLFEKRMEPVFLVMQLQARLNELFLINDSLASGRLSESGQWVSRVSDADGQAVSRLGKFDPTSKPPWVLGRLIAQARKWRPAQLRHARKVMLTVHERMTSVSVDHQALLEMGIADALSSGGTSNG